MTTNTYMSGRKKYGRPQAILFSNNPGQIVDGKIIPTGTEFGFDNGDPNLPPVNGDFLILSDDNRSPIDFKTTRIEKRQRMINGRMRSYYIGDKLTLSLSWKMLPSRAFLGYPAFGADGKATAYTYESPENGIPKNTVPHTSDGGAGGVELLKWYEEHPGPFYVFLAYDKYNNFDSLGTVEQYNKLQQYNQVVQMYISSFDYSIQKRGANTDDFWDISISLEEV